MLDFSIIIPVLNEFDKISHLVSKLKTYPSKYKVFICDGGSTDGTLEYLKSLNKEIDFELLSQKLETPSILATINIALEHVSTKYVMIHPIDVNALNTINQLALDPPHQNNYIIPFKKYDSPHLLLKIQEYLLNNIRVRLMKSFVWTNCPIIKTNMLIPLAKDPVGFLEDVILSDELSKLGKKPDILKTPVIVSSRRYVKDGTVSRFLGNIYIMLLFRLKLASIAKLKRIYLGI